MMGSVPADRADALRSLSKALRRELTDDILPYWMTTGRDRSGGGYFGEIDNADVADPEAEKSAVMIGRHLWTFSAAAQFLEDDTFLPFAEAAGDFLLHRLWDERYGGTYWSVSAEGYPLVRKKQIYAQAFTIYGLCEYSRTGGRIPGGRIPGGRIPGGRIPGGASAFETALGLFALLERYALDRENGGYFEALSQNWKPTDDRKLSPVDLDCEKSMNTNLHVLEAYTNLLRTGMFLYPPGTGAGDRSHARVAAALEAQVHIMEERVLQPDGHLGLFFSGDWSRLDGRVSFGHDIEASWLLCEARDVLRRYAQRSGGAVTLPAASEPALRLATVTLEEGYDPERGGVYDERDGDEIDPCRIWWVQAESMVGFLNAYQLTGKEEFIEALSRTWEFISVHMLDRDGGEWHWGVTDTGAVLDAYPKGGNWKTGYHNARACMEIIRRTEEVLRHEDA